MKRRYDLDHFSQRMFLKFGIIPWASAVWCVRYAQTDVSRSECPYLTGLATSTLAEDSCKPCCCRKSESWNGKNRIERKNEIIWFATEIEQNYLVEEKMLFVLNVGKELFKRDRYHTFRYQVNYSSRLLKIVVVFIFAILSTVLRLCFRTLEKTSSSSGLQATAIVLDLA